MEFGKKVTQISKGPKNICADIIVFSNLMHVPFTYTQCSSYSQMLQVSFCSHKIPSTTPSDRAVSTTLAHLRNPVSHFPSNHEALDEGAGGDECSGNLRLQLLGNVSKGLKLLHVFPDALQIVLGDEILGIQELEHALQQTHPEIVQHLLQIDVAACVESLQLGEQALEDLCVLQVGLSIRAQKHLVQRAFCALQQLQEELC